MMNNTKFECGTCHIEKPKREIKRINKEIVCINPCLKERRAKHREYLKRDILGIRKRSDLVKEWAEKRKNQEQERQERLPPKIKGQKKTGRGSRNPYVGIYLTSVEKQIIYKKYAHLGLDFAKERLNKITTHFNQMIAKKKEEGKTTEELNKTFKEEFAKLIMSEEDGK